MNRLIASKGIAVIFWVVACVSASIMYAGCGADRRPIPTNPTNPNPSCGPGSPKWCEPAQMCVPFDQLEECQAGGISPEPMDKFCAPMCDPEDDAILPCPNALTCAPIFTETFDPAFPFPNLGICVTEFFEPQQLSEAGECDPLVAGSPPNPPDCGVCQATSTDAIAPFSCSEGGGVELESVAAFEFCTEHAQCLPGYACINHEQ